MEQKKAVQKLTFVFFNSRHERRVTASPFGRLAAEACEVTENEIVASPVVDADGDDDADDDGVGADEILSSDDESLDDYLKDADELVMSPFANVSNRPPASSETRRPSSRSSRAVPQANRVASAGRR